MKFRLSMAMLTGLVLLLAVTGIAGAQSLCDTIASDDGGARGESTTICGEGLEGDSVTAFFDGSEVGSAVVDEYGEYCVTFDVPAAAEDGEHELAVVIEGEGNAECTAPFIVAGTFQPPADPVTETPVAAVVVPAPVVKVLPATGFALLPVGAAFASAGFGAMILRKRRR